VKLSFWHNYYALPWSQVPLLAKVVVAVAIVPSAIVLLGGLGTAQINDVAFWVFFASALFVAALTFKKAYRHKHG
jgi:hypothetical protein